MFQPPEDLDVINGFQKHHVSGLLYVGNFNAAQIEINNALNDDSKPEVAIVSCNFEYDTDKELKEKVEKAKSKNKLRHLYIGFGDKKPTEDNQASLNSLFEQAYAFIDDAILNNVPVLVHCAAGQSRSISLITAYLMRSANISLADAEKRVVAIRGTNYVAPNPYYPSGRFAYASIDVFREFLEDRERELQATK